MRGPPPTKAQLPCRLPFKRLTSPLPAPPRSPSSASAPTAESLLPLLSTSPLTQLQRDGQIPAGCFRQRGRRPRQRSERGSSHQRRRPLRGVLFPGEKFGDAANLRQYFCPRYLRRRRELHSQNCRRRHRSRRQRAPTEKPAGKSPSARTAASSASFPAPPTSTSGGASAAPGYWELYVRDLCTGINAPSGCVPSTKMVSVGDDGSAANAPSASPSISGDGRYIAFVSAATDLGGSATLASGPQVYVRDTCEGPTGTKSCLPSTLAVPVDAQDQLTGAQAGRPAISADGRYVAYEMWATPSTAQTAVSTSQIVLADTCLGVEVPVVCSASAERISYGPDGSALAGANISLPRSIPTAGSSPSNRNPRNPQTPPQAAPVRLFYAIPASDPPRQTVAPLLRSRSPPTPAPRPQKSQSFSPAVSASGRYVSFVSGIVSNAPAGEVATEGSLLVRDTCFAAGSPMHSAHLPGAFHACRALRPARSARNFQHREFAESSAADRGQVQPRPHQRRRPFRGLLRAGYRRRAASKRYRRRLSHHHPIPVIHDSSRNDAPSLDVASQYGVRRRAAAFPARSSLRVQ